MKRTDITPGQDYGLRRGSWGTPERVTVLSLQKVTENDSTWRRQVSTVTLPDGTEVTGYFYESTTGTRILVRRTTRGDGDVLAVPLSSILGPWEQVQAQEAERKAARERGDALAEAERARRAAETAAMQDRVRAALGVTGERRVVSRHQDASLYEISPADLAALLNLAERA